MPEPPPDGVLTAASTGTRVTAPALPATARAGGAGLAVAGLALGFLAFRAGGDAAEAARAGALSDLARRLDSDGIRAADGLRAAVASTQERGDVRAAVFPVEGRDVPWTIPSADTSPPELVAAASVEAAGDTTAAEAAWLALTETAGPARAAAWRAVARIRRSAGRRDTALEALRAARGCAADGDRDRFLADLELARLDPDGSDRVRDSIEQGGYAGADPAERADAYVSLGGDAGAVRHLVAARALADEVAPGSVIALPGGALAWKLPPAADARRVAVADLAAVLRAVHPAFRAGDACLDEGGDRLPAPFPATGIAPSPAALGHVEDVADAARAPWRVAGCALAAAFVAGAWLLVRHERARAALDRRRETFVCAVTHELKTPVANVLLYAETLERHGAEDPANVARFARVIASEALRLQARVQDVLDIASGRRVVEPDGAFDVADVVARVVADLGDRATVRGARIVVETFGAGQARGTAGLAARALNAVVTNAIEFGCRGTVRIRTEPGAGCVRIVVEDEGPGIPAEERERVFEPFVRLGDEMTRTVAGSGLGLPLARRCAGDCGGSVTAEAPAGRGARLVLTFPRPAAAAAGVDRGGSDVREA